MITAEILPVSITIDISTKTLDISTGAQIIHDFRVPSVTQDPVTKVVTIL